MSGDRLWLGCDYSADPAWWETDGAMVEIGDLKLSDETRAALLRWADWFELTSETQTLGADGRLHYFPGEAEEAAFEAEGHQLWRRARSELAGHHEVGYASRLARRRLWNPEEPAAQHAARTAQQRTAGYRSLYERAEHALARPELAELLTRLSVLDAEQERFELATMSPGVLTAVLARQVRQGTLSPRNQAALEYAGWPLFEGRSMPGRPK